MDTRIWCKYLYIGWEPDKSNQSDESVSIAGYHAATECN